MIRHHLIDNNRIKLSDTLNEISSDYDSLSIATGYWDIEGTEKLIDSIKDYKSVRLLIGQEPLPDRLLQILQLDLNNPENIFPDVDIEHDLEKSSNSNKLNALRSTVKVIVKMMNEGRLEVKVFRKPRLHAKAYIFGNYDSEKAVGIVGSSNFTHAGLTSNVELNSLNDAPQQVLYEPRNENQAHGHLSWFDEMWNDPEAVEWTGDFTKILADSPLGDVTYGPYDVYIKTLMELFPDIMVELEPLDSHIEDYLYKFQNQNALSLRQKLHTHGVAMLSDSVGLGKTVTAAAVIDQYIKEDRGNIVLILPASLKKQWIDELESKPWNLVNNRDFSIITQQNLAEIEELRDKSRDRKGSRNEINLFVIDEAHNLRNQNSARYQAVLELLQENPISHVLMLTATPINNSLMDFANQIQLGAKGDLKSVNVRYKPRNSNRTLTIDFFEALHRIQSEAARAEKQGKEYDWNHHKPTLVNGLRNYLVRATRQGVIKREAINSGDSSFPKSSVKQITYKFNDVQKEIILNKINRAIDPIFEGINPTKLNIDVIGNITQMNQHPIDLIKRYHAFQEQEDFESIVKHYNVSNSITKLPIYLKENAENAMIPSIFRLINLLGFTPYRIDTYHKNFYGKSIETIRSYEPSNLLRNARMQMSIHNMLQTTWLKRLESSAETLRKSVSYYRQRINLFEKWLDRGFLVNLTDAMTLESEYGDSIEKAFEDYEKYLEELNAAIESGQTEPVKKKGIERKEANENLYNIKQIRIDLERDKLISELLLDCLDYLSSSEEDVKLQAFADGLVKVINSGLYGNKVLVFSFFSDTIKHLENKLPEIIGDRLPNFNERSMFISGQSGETAKAAQLFSPKSQKYSLEKGEKEIDFLFATDVLSEGQNLQDAGILVNYDLHWNPVRMIQRNGRINRLGSDYDEILVANARPHDDLEEYLRLVRRLENKISTISNTVGTDQSILGEKENPIEFTDTIEESFGIYSKDEKEASKVWNQLENENDLLDWADSYALELRQFLDDHKEFPEEIKRIQSIPMGKWNYLPEKESSYSISTEIIGLYRTDGVYTATGEKIKDYAFVKIGASSANRGPFANISTEYMSQEEALERIKTTPEDNARKMDLIEVDRETYIKEGETELVGAFESIRSSYDIKPSGETALTAFKQYIPDLDLDGIIRNSITRSNEKREFERLVRKANKEITEQNQLTSSTINQFKNLLSKLIQKNEMETELKNIEGVLFYANL